MKKIVGSILLIAGVLSLSFGTYKYFSNTSSDNKKDDNKVEDKNNKKDDSNVTASSFNGKYTLGAMTLNVYKLSDEYVALSYDNSEYLLTESEKDVYTTSFDIFTVRFSDDSLEIKIIDTTEDLDIFEGVYKKSGDYTDKEYYSSIGGDIKYLDSELTGLFKSDVGEVYILRSAEDKLSLRVTITQNNKISVYGNNLTVTRNITAEYSGESFGNKDYVKVSLSGDVLTITASSVNASSGALDKDNVLNDINGTYKLDKKLDLDTAIKMLANLM